MPNDLETNPNKDLLVIELAHIIWFMQRGRDIDDPEELHKAWADEHRDASKLSQQVIAEMYNRGMLLSCFDKSLARFAPQDEVAS